MLFLPPWESLLSAVAMLLLGATVGSFLNVVIYRLPLGLSVNDPKRSFCPLCKKVIPMWRNIPLITWLIQRGRCAECAAPIPFRYFGIELFTALLWVATWWITKDTHALLGVYYAGLATLWLAVSVIDIDHMIIPKELSWFGVGWSLVGALLIYAYVPVEAQAVFSHALAAAAETSWLWVIGKVILSGAAGWLALWMCVLLGKVMFGRQRFTFDESVEWSFVEPKDENEELSFRLEEEDNYWSELFFRPKTDKVLVSGISDLKIDGKSIKAEKAEIWHDRVVVGSQTHSIEEMTSISGKLKKVVIPREAMGMGDVDLLGVFGMSLGLLGLLPIVLIACIANIITALIAKVGFGKHTPFGPSLVFGAVVWIVYGSQIFDWYSQFMETVVLVDQ